MPPLPDDPARFFDSLAGPFTGEAIFDGLADVVFFVKNARTEYVVVNRTLVERCGLADKRELLGRTAEDAFPGPLGRSFREQDEALIGSGSAIADQLELHLYPGGRTGWCLTNKLPLMGRDGKVAGLVGSSQDLRPPAEPEDGDEAVARAVGFARSHLDRQPTVADLAAEAGLSAYQLDRRVRRLFRLTTGQLLLKLRIDAAAGLLRDTDYSAARIALDCGYSDQSAFARQFRRTIGLTPLEYRAIRRPAGVSGPSAPGRPGRRRP